MSNGKTANAQRLLWAGFFSIFAAGVGFSVRAGILGDWARDYGFTLAELGAISGGGLWGFGLIIILVSLIAERIGYGWLMVFAFLMHILSAALQLLTGEIYTWFGGGEVGRDAVYWTLYIAMFMFSFANGTCEVVVNPMVATLFPQNKTHYLNILHAGWPGGLIVGGLVAYFMNEGSIYGWEPFGQVSWMVQMSMFLIPTLLYGLMMVGQKLPRSEASQAGVSYGAMLAEFAFPMLLLLLFIHALVGYVELGTDSWIGKITGSIMGDPRSGFLLFVYTSALMFALRFFAGPIVHHISPLGLLFASGVLGGIGLMLLGQAVGVIMCVLAATVYAVGKTFLRPTMLAVVSDLFPRGGAITIGAIGGVGMLSAGLLGTPGIGFKQDYFTAVHMQENSQTKVIFQRYAADTPKHFLVFTTTALDGSKKAILEQATEIANLQKDAREKPANRDKLLARAKDLNGDLERMLSRKGHEKLAQWWQTNQGYRAQDAQPVDEGIIYGGRMALLWTALVPTVMAVLYLLLLLYFRAKGGYRAEEITHTVHKEEERFAGGVEGPVEG